MKHRLIALALAAGLPAMALTQAPSLEKVWETDTIIAVPESVLPDPAEGWSSLCFGFESRQSLPYRQ
jgi:hypothetical protein